MISRFRDSVPVVFSTSMLVAGLLLVSAYAQRAAVPQDSIPKEGTTGSQPAGQRPLDDRIVDEYARLPTELQAVMQHFSGKTAAEVARHFPSDFPGHPGRDIGSGQTIMKCKFEEGDLIVPFGGLPSFHLKSGDVVWLARTRNPMAENIVGGYEMTTTPDKANHDNRYWLGNLKLDPSGAYAFKESGAFPKQRAEQKQNFFMNHPAGTFRIAYLWGLGPDTQLEVVAKGTTVAALTFESQDGKAEEEFLIATDANSRRLTFTGPAASEFIMDKGW